MRPQVRRVVRHPGEGSIVGDGEVVRCGDGGGSSGGERLPMIRYSPLIQHP